MPALQGGADTRAVQHGGLLLTHSGHGCVADRPKSALRRADLPNSRARVKPKGFREVQELHGIKPPLTTFEVRHEGLI
jgi:hypothetical protein